MKNKNLKNILIAAGLAVFVGVLTLEINADLRSQRFQNIYAMVLCPDSIELKKIPTPLRYGQKAKEVKILNQALACLGYLKSVPQDTVVAKKTAQALKKFYDASKLTSKVKFKNKSIIFGSAERNALMYATAQISFSNYGRNFNAQNSYGMYIPYQPQVPSTSQTSDSTPIPVQPVDYKLPDEYQKIFAESDWEKSPKLSKDFKLGHTFMDYYSDLYYKNYTDSTLDSVKKSGVGWVAFDNYNTYSSLEPPKIGTFPLASDSNRDTTAFREASEQELTLIIERAHSKGLKFFLMTEINYDGLAKKQSYGVTNESNDDLSVYSKRFEDFGHALDNGGSQDAQNFWDQWFATYTDFILGQAKIAQKTGVEMFAIGKQTSSATNPANADRWKMLIKKVREIYKGEITYVALEGKDFSEADGFPAWSDLDFVTLTLGNLAPSTDNKSISDLKSSLQNMLTSRFKKFADQTGKKIVILSYFQSATTQEWFEPSPPVYNSQYIVKDLLAQAKLYEALFQAVKDEPWVGGVFTWGYWWKDDLTNLFQPGDSGYDKSSDVRGKPAMEIIKKWAAGKAD